MLPGEQTSLTGPRAFHVDLESNLLAPRDGQFSGKSGALLLGRIQIRPADQHLTLPENRSVRMVPNQRETL